MKNLYFILTFVILIPLIGCGIGQKITQKDYELGKEKTVNVGSSMITYVFGSANMFDPNLLDEGIKEELVYSGKSGNTIKIDYRQYYGDVYNGWLIKDAFTQHLDYDLSSSDMIAYKSYKIQVLESNSSEISYKVLGD